jgi:hypothetical protein
MDYLLTKRLPCSVCGLVAFRRQGWFLVLENRWLDHLKILTWNSSLAMHKEIKSACCRQHLRLLVAHWLEQASLRLAPQALRRPIPISTDPSRRDLDLEHLANGCLLGELSVHRETFSRGWSGSPAALECILDALIPVADESDLNNRSSTPYPSTRVHTWTRLPLRRWQISDQV